jgi:type VI secretion system protein ImpA
MVTINMLTAESVNTLLAPISENSPCGDDLEYDPAFTALEAVARGKPEQQFGDTVIAAVEPEWRALAEQAQALLLRTKDLRPAVLLTRAAAHEQGLAGLLLGLQLLTGLLDRYWEHVYPRLDADDDNDPTMRINALTPLNDETMLVRDLYDAQVGVARSSGPLRVRDIAAAHGALTAGGETLSPVQIQGALTEIQAGQPELAQTLTGLRSHLAGLQRTISERSGRDGLLDLDRLTVIGKVLAQASATLVVDDAVSGQDAPDAGGGSADAATATAARGGGSIRSRQDALHTIDRVIAYLEQAEPGNPAPLLLRRAKQLIGVSFLDIIANLAPNAIDTIQTVTGSPSSGE